MRIPPVAPDAALSDIYNKYNKMINNIKTNLVSFKKKKKRCECHILANNCKLMYCTEYMLPCKDILLDLCLV